MKTIRDLVQLYPEISLYNYKWKDETEPELTKYLDDVLLELGYKLKDTEEVTPGDYNDIKGYYNCEIEKINH